MKTKFYIGNTDTQKYCPQCELVLHTNKFYARKINKYNAYCKSCTVQQGRVYYEKNREVLRSRQKTYQQETFDPERLVKYRQENREAIRQYQREYYYNVIKNKQKIKQMDNPPIMPKIGNRQKRRLPKLTPNETVVQEKSKRQLELDFNKDHPTNAKSVCFEDLL